MSRFSVSWRFFAGLVLLAAASVSAGCSAQFTPANGGASPQPPAAQSVQAPAVKTPTNGLVQSNAGGEVEIDVKWEGEKGGALVFEVEMNTHSVDLGQYDLGKLAVLRDDGGAEYRAVSWRASPGGHHRSGTLRFAAPASLSEGKARYVEMVIRDVSGVPERVLRWTLE